MRRCLSFLLAGCSIILAGCGQSNPSVPTYPPATTAAGQQAAVEDAPSSEEAPVGDLPFGEIDSYSVTNPSSGVDWYVQVIHPPGWSGEALPTLVIVPGGIQSGSGFVEERLTARLLVNEGYTVIAFDADGRGQTSGEEDQNGYIHQDGLVAVIDASATFEGVDRSQIGMMSFSYGITMASGALARYPDLPVRFLIDWEGPADRNDTGGCDADQTGHLKGQVDCDDESFWSGREALKFIRQIGVPYQRLQSQDDHAQPDVDHAVLMVNAAVEGGVPWVRLNSLEPNQTYDMAKPPPMFISNAPQDTAFLPFVDEMFALSQ